MDVHTASKLSSASKIAYANALAPFASSAAMVAALSRDLGEEGVSPAQANYTAGLYAAVAQQDTTFNGFSAILLHNREESHELVLAIRGSDQGLLLGPDGQANRDNL